MELMNQPFSGQLGNRLIELLGSPHYHTLNIVVAFAKNSGVLRIKEALERFRERGGIINAYVGVDLGGTSYEALTALLLHTDSLNIVHSENGQTFHPKIYQFLGNEKDLLIVGSHNLTGGGLWTNFESSIIIPTTSSERTTVSELNKYFEDLASLKESFMLVDAQDTIDNLLKNGYVLKEVSEQIQRRKAATQNGTRKRLFGKGAPAKLPRIAMSKEESTAAASLETATPSSVSLSSEGQTVWFETKSMTGGSRNILDLSMKSLVERGDPTGTSFDLGDPTFMRGAVEFFGLDPADTGQSKNITLNFEGIDYTGNTILFPAGENANGTWRLQIKGTSSSNRKITEALRAKGEGYYLVEKVVTFTRVEGDYYFMSVFPNSELDNFKAASRILARNGSSRNAKRLGIL